MTECITSFTNRSDCTNTKHTLALNSVGWQSLGQNGVKWTTKILGKENL